MTTELPQNVSAAQDTGESGEVQDKAQPTADPKAKTPAWLGLLEKFHNESNGLLAGKENLKIVSINLATNTAFYRKWSYEANQVMRLTASLRRRKKAGWLKFPKD